MDALYACCVAVLTSMTPELWNLIGKTKKNDTEVEQHRAMVDGVLNFITMERTLRAADRDADYRDCRSTNLPANLVGVEERGLTIAHLRYVRCVCLSVSVSLSLCLSVSLSLCLSVSLPLLLCLRLRLRLCVSISCLLFVAR